MPLITAIKSRFPSNTTLGDRLSIGITISNDILTTLNSEITNASDADTGISAEDLETLEFIKSLVILVCGDKLSPSPEQKQFVAALLSRDPKVGSMQQLITSHYSSFSGERAGGRWDTSDKVIETTKSRLWVKEPSAVILALIKAGELLADNDDLRIPVGIAMAKAAELQVLGSRDKFSAIVHSEGLFGGISPPPSPARVLQFCHTMMRLQGLVSEPIYGQRLWERDLTSAHEIAVLPRDVFAARMTGAGIEQPELWKIHDAAVACDAQNQETWTKILSSLKNDFVYTGPKGDAAPPAPPPMANEKGHFNMTEMFRLEAPACEECCSVTSASAYFVDLLDFLKSCKPSAVSSPDGPKNALEALTAKRRPDLVGLELSCKNCEEMMPYLALVNEILEAAVPRLTSGGSGIAEQWLPLDTHPYSPAIESVQASLAAIGLSRLAVGTTFGSEARIASEVLHAPPPAMRDPVRRHAATIAARARTADTLGLQPCDYAAISGELLGPALPLDAPGPASTETLRQNRNLAMLGQEAAARAQISTPALTEDRGRGAWTLWGYKDSAAMRSEDEAAADGLCFIKRRFMPRTGLSFAQVIELCGTLYFSGRLAVRNARGSKVYRDTGAPVDDMRLCVVDDNVWTPGPKTIMQLYAFLRLRARLGWSISELDNALACAAQHLAATACAYEANVAVQHVRNISPRTLETLADIVRCSRSVGLPTAAILPLWADINTHGQDSLYAQLFLSGAHGPCDAFKPDADGAYFAIPDAIAAQYPALLSALSLHREDLACIMRAAGLQPTDPLSLAGISALYRHTTLCRILGVAPAEYHSALRALGAPAVDPFYSPKTTLEVVEMWKRVTSAGGWSAGDVFSILDCGSDAAAVPSILAKGVEMDVAIALATAIVEGLDALEKTWGPMIRSQHVEFEAITTICAKLFESKTAEAVAAFVEGKQLTRISIPADSVEAVPDGLPGKLSIVFNLLPTASTITLTLDGVLTASEKHAALEKAALSPELVSVIEDLDRQARMPYQAITSRLYASLSKDVQERASKLFLGEEEVFAESGDELEEEKKLQSALLQRKKQAIFAEIALPTWRAEILKDLTIKSLATRFPNLSPPIIPVLLAESFHSTGTSAEEAPIAKLLKINFQDGSASSSTQGGFGGGKDTPQATLAGYFRPAASNQYQFHLPGCALPECISATPCSHKPDFNINHINVPLQVDASSTGKQGWKTSPVMMSGGHNYLLKSNSTDMAQITYTTKQGSPARLAVGSSFIPYDSVVGVWSVLRGVERMAYLVDTLALGLEELKYLGAPGGLLSFDINHLSLSDLDMLERYRGLRDAAAKEPESLIGLFGWLERESEQNDTAADDAFELGKLEEELAACTTWERSQIHIALREKYPKVDARGVVQTLCDFKEILALQDVMEVCEKVNAIPGVNLSMATLFQVATPTVRTHQASEAANAAAMRLALPERYRAQCDDDLREKHRTALVQYLLHQEYFIKRGIFDADNLFEYLLIDVQMGPKLQITRMKQAISTVQLFVQRCLLGLEVENGIRSGDIDHARWEWMQKHNVWQATRRAYLYPENWLEPTLRDDKTGLFEAYEAAIMQKDLDWHTFAGAVRAYVQGLAGIAHLDIQAYLLENRPGAEVYHIFARTRSAPYVFYHRALHIVLPARHVFWAPWAKIDVDITTHEADLDGSSLAHSGAYLLPVMRGNRLFLYTPQIVAKTLAPQAAGAPGSFEGLRTKNTADALPARGMEVRMAWTECVDGAWTAKQVSEAKLELGKRAGRMPSIANLVFSAASHERDVRIDVGFWINSVFIMHENLGWFAIDGERIRASTDVPNVGFQTVPTEFHRYSCPGGTRPPDRLLLACADEQTLSHTSAWALSFGSDAEGAATGLAVDQKAPNGGESHSIFMYPNPDADGADRGVKLTSSNLRKHARAVRIEHPGSKMLMEKAYEREGVHTLFNAMFAAGTGTDAAGEAVDFGRTLDSTSGYHELASPYALYNWELGLHAVLLAVDRFLATRQFELALRAARLVFDPTVDPAKLPAGTDVRAACWKFPPFKHIATHMAASAFTGWPKDAAALDLAATERPRNPSTPHATARFRPEAYMKWIVMKYIEIVVAAGDQHFRTGSMESLPLAIQRYVEAAHVLGPEPARLPKLGKPVVRTYATLGDGKVDLELSFPFICDMSRRPAASPVAESDPQALLCIMTTSYFCLPANPQYQSLRGLVNDRLYKARNNLDINGRPIVYSMTEPYIDPGALARAQAGGGAGVSALLNDMDAPMPFHRFAFLIRKALEMCAELRSASDDFLQAKEKQDAEALCLLRARHSAARQSAALGIKALQRAEAEQTLEALMLQRADAVSQLGYYLRLIGEPPERIPDAKAAWVDIEQQIDAPATDDLRLNAHERSEMAKADEATQHTLDAASYDAGMAVLRAMPSVTANIQPLGCGISLGSGPQQMSELVGIFAAAKRTRAVVAGDHAQKAARKAQLARQLQDRRMQANSKGREIKAIDKHAEIQGKRLELIDRETAHQRQESEWAAEVEQWYLSKYTSEKLYAWLEHSIRAIHSDLYQMASDLARRAERALKFEKAATPLTFLRTGGYWDSSRDGLLSGQQLHLDLRRMEAAYLEKPAYDYQLTKNISLRQVDPLALISLQETGSADFSLPEVMFDFDFPGHYMRRIKSVSISIPCLLGPYTSLSATLTLTQHKYRVGSAATTPEDYAAAHDDAQFRTDRIPLSSIAITSGIHDSGVFSLDFKDDRFLPFEGAGVISSWKLELPPAAMRQFDYRSISDIVMHVRYTSLDGGPLLKKAAAGAVQGFISKVGSSIQNSGGLCAYFDVRNDFSEQWWGFVNSKGVAGVAGDGEAQSETAVATAAAMSASTLHITNFRSRLPYFTTGQNIKISEIEVVLTFSSSDTVIKPTDISLSIPELGEDMAWTSSVVGKGGVRFRAEKVDRAIDEWRIVVSEAGGKGRQKGGWRERVVGMGLVVGYTVGGK
ncbi:hypothetical protein DFH27DRAFT_526698 [Peziza echinospora]|nr:hypothetical protein DFH27DRAFT_526698 [Peziza echinospora]